MTLIGVITLFGQREIERVRDEIQAALCDGLDVAIELRSRDIERALFEGVLDHLKSGSYTLTSLNNTIKTLERHYTNCPVLEIKLAYLRTLRDGLTHYAIKSYEYAYDNFENLDKQTTIYFYLTGAALYRLSVQQKDLNPEKSAQNKESAGERMMSAYESAQPHIGVTITKDGHLKLKCNALGIQYKNEEWEECLTGRLDESEGGSIYANLAIANLRIGDNDEVHNYLLEALKNGFPICKFLKEDEDLILYRGNNNVESFEKSYCYPK